MNLLDQVVVVGTYGLLLQSNINYIMYYVNILQSNPRSS